MALTGIEYLLANNNELLPHIEEGALTFIMHQYAMMQNSTIKTDMIGMNTRKISQYLPTRRAKQLQENTDIPDTVLNRARLSEITPVEVGEQYQVSNRRVDTDPEDLLADIATGLGKSVGDKIESDLFTVARTGFMGGDFGSFASEYTLGVGLATRMRARQLFPQQGSLAQVMHPYAVLPILQDLVTLSGSESGQAALANLNTAQTAAVSYNIPALGEVTAAPLTPRRVVLKLAVYGTGGTFRLQVGDDSVIGENITAAITVSATPATTAGNVQTALNALDMSAFYSGSGSWAVTGSANNDLTITPPSDFFIDDNSQLRVAIKVDAADDVTLDGNSFDIQIQKSAYDLVTGLSGAPLDMNGNSLGVDIKERSATAYGFTFFPSALIFDERGGFSVGSDLTLKQKRTYAYFISGFYGAGIWTPQHGFRVLSKADSPTAVGA